MAKTFRVLENNWPRKTFTYENAQEMWDSETNNIWSSITSQFHGTTAGAKKIEQGLLELNKVYNNPNNAQYLLPEDLAILDYLSNFFNFQGNFLDFTGWRKGEEGEKRLAKLIEASTTGINNPHIGASSAPSRVGEISLNIDFSDSGISDTKSFNKAWFTKGFQQQFWNMVKQQTGNDYKKILGNLTMPILTWTDDANKNIGTIVFHQANGTGKGDITGKERDANYEVVLTSQFGQIFQAMIQELIGHTYSIKNYTQKTLANWGGVSLGESNIFRRYASFLYASGNSMSYVDLCTFIFVTNETSNQNVKRYAEWAQFIYELSGIGQEDAVDYLIINTSDVGVTNIKVYSVADLISQAPTGQVPAAYKAISFTGKNGHTYTKNKYIFKV